MEIKFLMGMTYPINLMTSLSALAQHLAVQLQIHTEAHWIIWEAVFQKQYLFYP